MLLFLALATFQLALAGVTWTQIPDTVNTWRTIASDTSGQRAVATDASGSIFVTSNNGKSWTKSSASLASDWFQVTSDASGKNLAASSQSKGIFLSNDFGATWKSSSAFANGFWYSIASDATGQKLAAGNGFIYFSSDYGGTWKPNMNLSGSWNSITSSSDGQRLYAINYNQKYGLYNSVDGGATWSYLACNHTLYWSALASDSTGQTILVGNQDKTLQKSSDFGQTWTQVFNGEVPNALAISGNGKVGVMITTETNNVYVTSGNTWTKQDIANVTTNSHAVAIDSEGKYIYIAQYKGSILLGTVVVP